MTEGSPRRPPPPAFPPLDWEEDAQDTRPMGAHEFPLPVQVERQLAVVAALHGRIALAIESTWGYPECARYLRTLVLEGDTESGHRRGFKPAVLSALMHLSELHKRAFGAQGIDETRP